MKAIDQLVTIATGRARDVRRLPTGIGWLVSVTGLPRQASYLCPVLVRDGDQVELRGYPGDCFGSHVRPANRA